MAAAMEIVIPLDQSVLFVAGDQHPGPDRKLVAEKGASAAHYWQRKQLEVVKQLLINIVWPVKKMA